MHVGNDSVSGGTEFSKEVRRGVRWSAGPGLSSNVDLRYSRSLEEERRDMEWEWATVTGTAYGRVRF